jgi:hypothetical protein
LKLSKMTTPSTLQKRTIWVALAFVALGCSEGRAAVGWDLKECERHFGKPVRGPFEGRHGDSHNYFFRSKPWKMIEANFSDATGQVIFITYGTSDKQVLDNNREALLKENAPGVTKWIENKEASEQYGDGMYRQVWDGAADQGSYTADVTHDATGDYFLTVAYEGASKDKQARAETSPSPFAGRDQDFTAQVTNIVNGANDTVAVGTATNNSSRTIYAMKLSVNFYGDQGRLLDTVDTVAEGRANGIKPGEVAAWKAISTQDVPVRKVEAVVTDVQTNR